MGLPRPTYFLFIFLWTCWPSILPFQLARACFTIFSSHFLHIVVLLLLLGPLSKVGINTLFALAGFQVSGALAITLFVLSFIPCLFLSSSAFYHCYLVLSLFFFVETKISHSYSSFIENDVRLFGLPHFVCLG